MVEGKESRCEMTLYDKIDAARLELVMEGRHLEALHLGDDAHREFIDALFVIDKSPLPGWWKRMEMRIGPDGTGPNYAAIRYKFEERGSAIMFKVIQQ
jgi:hypothetical protein